MTSHDDDHRLSTSLAWIGQPSGLPALAMVLNTHSDDPHAQGVLTIQVFDNDDEDNDLACSPLPRNKWLQTANFMFRRLTPDVLLENASFAQPMLIWSLKWLLDVVNRGARTCDVQE